MTTTVRPAGPEQRGRDGSRARDFSVCVNGRPVGTMRLATDERFGPSHGRILSLAIDPADQRRGRGCVAALAAEEVLRGWGCARVEASVLVTETAALRLASALGYTESHRTMVKRLPVTPPPPGAGTVRPMTAEEYPAWAERQRGQQLRSWQQHGVPHQQATARVAAEYAAALPDGHATPGAALRVLSHDAVDVGWLWLRLPDRSRPDAPAWVFSVEVAAEHRRRGHGRTLLLLAERESLAAGSRDIGLRVLTGNAAALGLYAALGYRPMRHHLSKALP